jgi:hypothetical protein
MTAPSLTDLDWLLSAPDGEVGEAIRAVPKTLGRLLEEGQLWPAEVSVDTIRMAVACAMGHVSGVRSLLEKDPTLLSRPCSCPVLPELVGVKSPNDLPYLSFPPLLVASIFGRLDLVRFLLEQGANPNTQHLGEADGKNIYWTAPQAATILLLEDWNGGGHWTGEVVAILDTLLNEGCQLLASLPDPDGDRESQHTALSLFVYAMQDSSGRWQTDPGALESCQQFLEGWSTLMAHPALRALAPFWKPEEESFDCLQQELADFARIHASLPPGMGGRGQSTVLGFVMDHLMEAGFSPGLFERVPPALTAPVFAIREQRHLEKVIGDAPVSQSASARVRL